MGNFDTRRSEAIRKKNEGYVKAETFEQRSENLDKQRKEYADAKSAIPEDIPEYIRAQIDAMFEQKDEELDEQSEELADEIKEAQDDLDKAIYDMRSLGDELSQKAERLDKMKNVPFVGAFLERKGEELEDQKDQMYDLAGEARQYSDKLAASRLKAMRKS